MTRRIVVVLILVASAGAVIAASPVEIRGPSLGGGAGRVDAVPLSLDYSIGQTVVGTVANGTHELRSGGRGAAPHATAVGPGIPPGLPVVDRLHPAHPNPFNPQAVLSFDLARPTDRVSLRIYDLRGSFVRSLVDGPHAAGTHRIVWDGRDRRGARLSSGVYLVRLCTPDLDQTEKVTLVR